jgi:predicted Zn-ribbon and HTH transcriptional regulator
MISKDIFEVLDEIKDEKVIELLQHIKRLVERDIPQKHLADRVCPGCGCCHNNSDYNYCPNCGKSLIRSV